MDVFGPHRKISLVVGICMKFLDVSACNVICWCNLLSPVSYLCNKREKVGQDNHRENGNSKNISRSKLKPRRNLMSRLYRSSFPARFCDVDITVEKSGKGDPEKLKEWLVRNKHSLWQCNERNNIQSFQSNPVF